MNLKKLTEQATDKANFRDLQGYISFCQNYLDYVSKHLQAVIVSQNEHHYQFFQYGEEGNFQITRPVNSRLMLDAQTFATAVNGFQEILLHSKNITQTAEREILNICVYSIQQSIGAALDALPAGSSNKARKLNGDLFENFIRLIISKMGISCRAGVVQIPVEVDGKAAFSMSYQHDLIIENQGKTKLLGSVKTSSKDRLDKIFIDKFLFNKLTESAIPHIAIFLNDVQRKNTKHESEYGINSTFLPGHFKGYTVKLNPLDGVYYCDIRPNMATEPILKDHIKTFDCLLCDDIWRFL